MARRMDRIPGGRVRWTLLDLAAPHERAAAWLIDTGIFWGLLVGGMIWLTETGELGTPPRLTAPRAFVWLVVVWAVSRAYDAACVHLWGSSVGRRVAGIEVRASSGTLPDRWHAVLRAVVRTPAVALLGAGLFSIRSDRQRRALHDRVADTVVVRSDAVERLSEEGEGERQRAGGRGSLGEGERQRAGGRGSLGEGERQRAGGPGSQAEGGLVAPESTTQVDANERAIRRANVAAQQASWLRAIAEQTEVRLDIANPSWRRADDPDAIHRRAFCLLLARLIERYPGQRAVIVGVLDNHDELAEIEGNRERVLTRLLDEPERARRWIGLSDGANLRIVLDEPAWLSESGR